MTRNPWTFLYNFGQADETLTYSSGVTGNKVSKRSPEVFGVYDSIHSTCIRHLTLRLGGRRRQLDDVPNSPWSFFRLSSVPEVNTFARLPAKYGFGGHYCDAKSIIDQFHSSGKYLPNFIIKQARKKTQNIAEIMSDQDYNTLGSLGISPNSFFLAFATLIC